ncbi:MAG TPA: CheR family methyltransferase, partial [Burkholderiales bacterium]|nr:CheR family methyltransferase [Burkholderiales bacterium]
MTDSEDAQFEGLLQFLEQQRGIDFTGYKRPSLMRRVRRRMHTLEAKTFEDYRDYLEVHPDEFALLFNTILINVTSFFRDPEAFRALCTEVFPHILAGRSASTPVRVWVPGCATGEEAYSVAMCLL